MDLATEYKIKKFHYEEILLILFICASDISKYQDDDLVIFTEAIEGRIEVHRKMQHDNLEWKKANSLAKKLLGEIGVNYIEPHTFMDSDSHLNVDWI